MAMTAALYLAVSACQPLPQPFAHPESATNPVVIPPSDFGGVTILPTPDLPISMARKLSMALAEELQRHEIIASPDSSNQRSKFLQAGVTQGAAGDTRTRITIVWDLTDGSGKILGSKETTHIFSKDGWAKGNQTVLRRLVKSGAADIAEMVKSETELTASKSQIALHVWPLDGAPNRTTGPLRLAMETALKKRNFRIVNALEDARLVVAGSIELGPENAELRPVRIVWSVMNTSGQELGNLTQKNALTRREIEQQWESLATVIADNAAGGVGAIVARLPRKVLENDGKRAK